jgi:pimeloyl-ACP methyl ester carboxylesterase
VRLHVEEHGDGDPLLLVEGLAQSTWAWREQIPVFARRFRTIAFDTRGTGRSPAPAEPYGIPELADDAARLLDGRAAHVVGLSMGGYVALTLALARPALVRSLVLVGTGAGGTERVPRPDHVREAFAAAQGLPLEEYGRITMPYTFASGWPEANPVRFQASGPGSSIRRRTRRSTRTCGPATGSTTRVSRSSGSRRLRS